MAGDRHMTTCGLKLVRERTPHAGRVPVAGMFSSLPKVGVDAALCEAMEEMEEELSARARGANGGGLPETGGLNGRLCRPNTKQKFGERRQKKGRKSDVQRWDGVFHAYQVCDWFPRGQLWSRRWTGGRRRGDGAASRLRRGGTSWRRGSCKKEKRKWTSLPGSPIRLNIEKAFL